MSKSRSVKHNFEFSAEFLKSLPQVNARKVLASPSSPLRSDDSLGSIDSADVFDYQIESYGKTSSSSPSCGEEYYICDDESTERARTELERMERVLQGLEEIPSNYPRDEYQLWIDTFPQLRLIGIKPDTSKQDENLSQLTNQSYKSDSTKNKQIDGEQKYSVIDKVIERVASRLTNSNTGKRRPTPDISNQFDDVFSLSTKPLVLHDARKRKLNVSKQFNSSSRTSQLTGRSQKYSSRSTKDLSWIGEFSSLPHLCQPTKNMSALSLKSRSLLVAPVVSQSNNFVVPLPPIKNHVLSTTALSASQYRSISVTPRNGLHGRREVPLVVASSQTKRPPYRLQKLTEAKSGEIFPKNNKG